MPSGSVNIVKLIEFILIYDIPCIKRCYCAQNVLIFRATQCPCMVTSHL